MRENIGLYRGKRIDNDEWIEGCLVKKIDPMLGVEYCFILAQEYDTSCIDGQPTHLKSFMTWYKVDPETVGECLGVPDKNGKKIFEGDIVRLYGEDLPGWYYKSPITVVKYNGFGFEPLCEYDCSCDGFVRPTDCEVIGNIYDNSELLEAADG